MTKTELMQHIGEYGGLREDAGFWGGRDDSWLEDEYMRKSLVLFEIIAKELDKLYD